LKKEGKALLKKIVEFCPNWLKFADLGKIWKKLVLGDKLTANLAIFC
jgi:hypothetical protein